MRSAAVLLVLATGCSTLQQDAPAAYDASPLGNGLRLSQIQDPSSPNYHPCVGATVSNCESQTVSSAVVTWLDTFDETKDGKSKGTLYIQDVGTPRPYGAIGNYETNFVPASLSPLPGDVLDFLGPYQESSSIGSAMFAKGTFLPQLYKPVGTFRYEDPTQIVPVDISVQDLEENGATVDSAFPRSRKWMGMLVRLSDVSIGTGADVSLRVTYSIANADGGFPPSSPAITNELFDLKADQFKPGTVFKHITGIVTWFYSFQIAPRTLADFETESDQ